MATLWVALGVTSLSGCSFKIGSTGGDGSVAFGTSLTKDSSGNYQVQNAKSTFHASDTVAFVANFKDKIGGTGAFQIRFLQNGAVTKQYSEQGKPNSTYYYGVRPEAVMVRLAGVPAGKVTMRFTAAGKKLAEGSFTLAR